MHKLFFVFAIFFLIIACHSCSPSVKQPRWDFEREAVKIHVRADQQLNMYNGQAHTLYICIYQLTSENDLEQLARDTEGIYKLLECGLFDDSVRSAESRVIHAGERSTLILDRAEDARHLAVVAGYSAGLTRDRVVRRHRFQSAKHLESYFKQHFRCTPCELNIELSLGPRQIEYSSVLSNQSEPECIDECE